MIKVVWMGGEFWKGCMHPGWTEGVVQYRKYFVLILIFKWLQAPNGTSWSNCMSIRVLRYIWAYNVLSPDQRFRTDSWQGMVGTRLNDNQSYFHHFFRSKLSQLLAFHLKRKHNDVVLFAATRSGYMRHCKWQLRFHLLEQVEGTSPHISGNKGTRICIAIAVNMRPVVHWNSKL